MLVEEQEKIKFLASYPITECSIKEENKFISLETEITA